jgi:subtilisin family serine protease
MRPASIAGALAFATAITVGTATGASAGTVEDGQWYIDGYEVRDLHDQGLDGSGVKVAVIDTGINPDLPEFEGADLSVHEPSYCYGPEGEERPAASTDISSSWHGSNVTAMIVGNGTGYSGEGVLGYAPKASVTFYDVGPAEGDCYYADGGGIVSQWDLSGAMNQAIDDGADIISVSLTTNADATDALARAMREGVIVVGALANDDSAEGADSVFQGDFFPGINNGVISVAAFGPDGQVPQTALGPLTSPYTDVVAPGIDILTQGDPAADWEEPTLQNGTSFSTPITTGNLALVMQKYPEATGNQVIQSLIRNTDAEPHELYYDDTGATGYGSVDTISLLAADPTQYDDVNPLLVEDDGSVFFWGPTIAEVSGDGEASASPTASPAPPEESASASPSPQPTSSAAPDADSSSSTPLALILALVAIIIAAVVVIVIIVVRNRSQGDSHGNV